MRYLVALGRLFGHFTHPEMAYAAAQGIPVSGLLLPASAWPSSAAGAFFWAFMESAAPGFWCSFSCR